MQRNRLTTIFIVVLIDLLGFGLILPLLPYYAATFGLSTAAIGLLIAAYPAAQLVSTPLLGRLSDRLGRRPLLLVSVFGTLLSFLLLGVAGAGWMLFVSRILDGLTGGNISVAQAYITDVTDEKNRARGLGIIGAAFGLGFIIGPAVGGALSVYGYGAPAFVAAGLALINLVAIYFFLPESLSPQARLAAGQRPKTAFTLSAMLGALRRPRLGSLLIVRLVFSMASSTFETVFALYAQRKLGLSAQSTGFVLTYVGILIALVQGLAIGRLTQRYKESQLIFGGMILMTVALVGWALSPNLVVLLIVLAPLALASGVLNTAIRSALTKVVQSEEVGGALGLAASFDSATRVLAPTIGSVLLAQVGTFAPGLFGAALTAWLIWYSWSRLIRRPAPQAPQQP